MTLIIAVTLLLAQTFASYAADAQSALLRGIYNGHGAWRLCERGCGAANRDWGADSLTYALALRQRTNPDGAIARVMEQLVATAPAYAACDTPACPWSDEPAWDSIAASRMYEITHAARALQLASDDYAYVKNSRTFALGACRQVPFQRPFGAGGGLKTLETGANEIGAALLLYGETRNAQYLRDAASLYAAVRRYFLDPQVGLYTVYVFDDGTRCTQVPHRFFASVNGRMIENGIRLSQYTHNVTYLADAYATEGAVETKLADGAAVFADLQAENDIVEPLVEAMFDLATIEHRASAKTWIETNARAALRQDRDAQGWYGRFFDGPAPNWNVTAWQSNGGFALAFAAAAVDPRGIPHEGAWKNAQFVPLTIAALPSQKIRFSGSAIAFTGSIGDRCCEAGHAAILLDGEEIFNRTGIWQNKSSAGITIPNAVLFAWRWAVPGTHTIQFVPSPANAKEGSAYLRLQGYWYR